MIPTTEEMKKWREEAAEITGPNQRLLFLADKLERLEAGHEAGTFDVEHVRHDCGAPACIAGWAEYFWPEHGGSRLLRDAPGDWGGALGLSEDDSCMLFYWINPLTGRSFRRPETAARILRQLGQKEGRAN